MKQFRTLRVVIIAKLTASANGPGRYSVTINPESVPLPASFTAGSTGTHTARLGPMIIDLVPVGTRPPLTDFGRKGPRYFVYFGIGSAEIDNIGEVDEGGKRRKVHQGNAFDAWITDHLIKSWDVREALYSQNLKMSGEARASATWKGIKDPAERKRRNLALSKKRKDAVVNRLLRTLKKLDKDIVKLDTEQLEAVGEGKVGQFSKIGEETVGERYCSIVIEPTDLEDALREWLKPPGERTFWKTAWD
jgi:hypothetical protein